MLFLLRQHLGRPARQSQLVAAILACAAAVAPAQSDKPSPTDIPAGEAVPARVAIIVDGSENQSAEEFALLKDQMKLQIAALRSGQVVSLIVASDGSARDVGGKPQAASADVKRALYAELEKVRRSGEMNLPECLKLALSSKPEAIQVFIAPPVKGDVIGDVDPFVASVNGALGDSDVPIHVVMLYRYELLSQIALRHVATEHKGGYRLVSTDQLREMLKQAGRPDAPRETLTPPLRRDVRKDPFSPPGNEGLDRSDPRYTEPRVAFIIDASENFAPADLEITKRETNAVITKLKPIQSFIVCYASSRDLLMTNEGRLAPAIPPQVRKVPALSETVAPGGEPELLPAIRHVLSLKPSKVYILSGGPTDARRSAEAFAELLDEVKTEPPVIINCVFYKNASGAEVLAPLAESTGGKCVYLDADLKATSREALTPPAATQPVKPSQGAAQ